MKFSTRADVKAPIDYVFEQITNITTLERSIMHFGGNVERIAGDDEVIFKTRWRVKFVLNGIRRSVMVKIIEVEKPNNLTFEVTSKNIDATLLIELVALSHSCTRLNVTAMAKAKTIAVKLLFQSICFAGQKNQMRFKAIVLNFATDLEIRHRG